MSRQSKTSWLIGPGALALLAAMLLPAAFPAVAIELDEIATVEDTLEVGPSGLFNGSFTDGGFDDVQTSGPFVATFTFVESCDLISCSVATREIAVRRDTDGGLEDVRRFEDLPDSFQSFELAYYPGCVAPSRCDVPLLAAIFEQGSSLTLEIVDASSGGLVLAHDFAGAPPFSFSFTASRRDEQSALIDLYVGFPEAGANGQVRAFRFDGDEVLERVIDAPPAIVRNAKGLEGARFGTSIEVTENGPCIGQTPLPESALGNLTEASISLASNVFANLGAPNVSTSFGKFPLGGSVQASGNRCASAEAGVVTVCTGTCSAPLQFGGVGGEQDFGRSISLAGPEIFVGGGNEDVGGQVFQYVVSGSQVIPLATITSSNPAFGANPLQPTPGGLVTTLSSAVQNGRTRTDLLRLDGVQDVLFTGGFELSNLR